MKFFLLGTRKHPNIAIHSVYSLLVVCTSMVAIVAPSALSITIAVTGSIIVTMMWVFVARLDKDMLRTGLEEMKKDRPRE